jgi:glutamyl-tRNA reductase
VTCANAWAAGSLLTVGVNHHTATVELRERLAFDLGRWQACAPPVPHILLQTRNRTEVYAWDAGRGSKAAGQLSGALAKAAGVFAYSSSSHSNSTPAALTPYLVVRRGRDAIVHLVRVATGLDSLLVGEEQILGQVRSALRLAHETGTSVAPLDGVVGRALEAGRRIRAATMLGRRPSVASAAVAVGLRTPELAATGLAGRLALVLGAGTMARSAAQALLSAGVEVSIINRTFEHAQRLARELGHGVRAAVIEALPHLLAEASLLVAATKARGPMLDVATVQAAARSGSHRLVLVDVALPRNIEPAVRAIPGVRLIDLDDLERLCPVDITLRRAEIERAEALAVEDAQAIERWVRVRAMSPTIATLRRQGDAIRFYELRRAAPQLANLTPEEFSAVTQLTESIVNKLLHGPTLALREAAAGSSGLDASQQVFDILRLDQGRHVQR